MKASLYYGKGDIRIENVEDPKIVHPQDAIVRITHACICGSDLWFYRGFWPHWEPGFRTGHEWMGVVEAVGSEVRNIKPGDRVLAPFMYSDNSCEFCEEGLQTSCIHGGFWGGENNGGQAEAIRCPQADGTLVKVPGGADNDEKLLKALLPLTDVMGTGYHAAVSAKVKPGHTVAVIGDGAVGLCGVLSAKKLGAERIIVFGHHAERLEIAKKFGATDVIKTRGKEAEEEVRQMTKYGVNAALECVGTDEAMNTAIKITRPGGAVGFVGVPHGDGKLRIDLMFGNNVSLNGGLAPVRAYADELMKDVLAGKLDPGPVLDMEIGLDEVPNGYAAMDQRKAIKVMVRP